MAWHDPMISIQITIIILIEGKIDMVILTGFRTNQENITISIDLIKKIQ